MHKPIVAVLFTVFFAAPALLVAQQDTTSVDEAAAYHGLMAFYMRGAEAEAEGRFAEAQQAFEQGVAVYPDSPHLRLGVARTSAGGGDQEACLAALSHLADVGGTVDLTAIEVLKPFLERPDFQALGRALTPDDPPPLTAESVLTLQDADLWNEGIACDLITGDLYAGSVKLSKVVRVRNGVQKDFGTTARDSLLEVIGLDIDQERRRLWAAVGRDETAPDGKHDFGEMPRENAIVVYDLESGRQLHRFDMIPDGRIHMWNDVTVSPDGTAYFTDMTVGEIHRIRPGGSPELFLVLEEFNYPNGIVARGDGRFLYIACLEGILVVDLVDGSTSPLNSDPDICTGLGDGLALNRDSLFIVQNTGLLGNRVLQCRLDASGLGLTAAHILQCPMPPGLMPYTCAFGQDVLYVNGTAPFAQYDEPTDPPASVIVEIGYQK